MNLFWGTEMQPLALQDTHLTCMLSMFASNLLSSLDASVAIFLWSYSYHGSMEEDEIPLMVTDEFTIYLFNE